MRVVRSLLLALGATAVAVGVGVVVTDDEEPRDPVTTDAPSVPLTGFDTTRLVAERAAFCDDVPDEAVAEALGGEAVAAAAYGNGDRAKVTATTRDVAHEFSCAWRGPDGTVARAWVFAPPVTLATAGSLIVEARTTRGCEPDTDAPAYGVPSLALGCTEGDKRLRSYRGLFGDAWLTCELAAPDTTPAASVEDRASRWCVSVASAVEAAS